MKTPIDLIRERTNTTFTQKALSFLIGLSAFIWLTGIVETTIANALINIHNDIILKEEAMAYLSVNHLDILIKVLSSFAGMFIYFSMELYFITKNISKQRRIYNNYLIVRDRGYPLIKAKRGMAIFVDPENGKEIIPVNFDGAEKSLMAIYLKTDFAKWDSGGKLLKFNCFWDETNEKITKGLE